MLARTRLGAIHAHLVRAFSTPIGTDKVIYDRKNPYVLEVTLNKEKALNALDSEMIASLSQNVEQWNKDPNLKVVLMRGKGKKAFCAGGDVKTLYDARVAEKNPNVEPEILDSFFRSEFECDYKLASMKPLQIALWDGIVMGGGVGISIHAPFRIATENSMFAMPEAKLGFFTDVSGGYFLSRLKDNFGLYLGLTSQRLKGMDLVRAGVANYYIPSERVPELEKRLFDNPKPESLSKSALGETIKSLSEKVDGELPNAAVIKKIFGCTTLEEVFDLLRKQPQDNKFAQETLKLLEGNSPLSLKVIWEQIRRAKSQDLKEALKADFRTSQKFMGDTEFFEGVRCVLVDKGATPNWRFKTINDIKDSDVSKFFEPLSDKSKDLAI